MIKFTNVLEQKNPVLTLGDCSDGDHIILLFDLDIGIHVVGERSEVCHLRKVHPILKGSILGVQSFSQYREVKKVEVVEVVYRVLD